MNLFRLCLMCFYIGLAYGNSPPTLHLLSWWGMFPKEILSQFEAETGIKVINDFMESNEVLDAKLSVGKTGYDLVTPSFLPFGARQLQGGLYQPLKKEYLPYWKNLDPKLLKRMEEGDPHNHFAVPIVWGVTGLAYDEAKLKARLPDAPLRSWRLLFDPQVLKHFADCHVTLLEEVSDVLIPALLAWKYPVTGLSLPLLQEVQKRFMEIRPYISRFDSIKSSQDLMAGNVCMVMQWTGGVEYARAHLGHPEQTSSIKTIIPEEGSVMWIDTLMIPHDALHVREAHLFINFILQPHIMAEITNRTYYANAVPQSKSQVSKSIRSHPAIYPPEAVMKKVWLNPLDPPRVMRQANRLMTNFKRGKAS